MKPSNHVAIALAATLLTACQVAAPGLPPSGGALTPGVSNEQAGPRAIAGRVIFPSGDRQVTAASADLAAYATVAVIDPGTARTMATGLTNAQGAFAIDVDTTFSPVLNGHYYLQVLKRTSGPTANHLSMLTVLKWTGSGWASITNRAGGVGTIVVNPTTTAVALIDREDPATSLDDILGTVAGSSFDAVSAFQGNSVAMVLARVASVTTQLLQDLDPLGDRPILASGLLAPGDSGDESTHHDYQVTKNGQVSTFVWIPVFTAYQLIVPANCGATNAASPVGTWVKTQPSSGIEGTDWARESFGGFYAGKYEASRNDATNAAVGTATALKVQADRVPWTNVSWDGAVNACLAYDAHCHLMRDDEWTALAVWSMINNVTVYGNNNTRKDHLDAAITFTADPNVAGRALTGSGTKAGWAAGVNLTTHTGTTGGVYDLNGNVWEWTGTIGTAQTSGNYIVNDVTLPVAVPGQNFVTQLSTDPRLRRYGLPGATGGSASPVFGGDYIWTTTGWTSAASRGGRWADGGSAGVWGVYVANDRTTANTSYGFRPVLKY
ncbi:SUMF1/EgtB/PvdO family nonheme iron enzyme [bacterium]|nr:SUMF1/EgtB/PvdO family nonheme iron enzyme [bacterium]